MKNKSAVLFSLGLVMALGGSVYAATGVRGAKGVAVMDHSTTPVIVTKSAGAVYSIVFGTGAVTDYVVLIDSANATAATAITATGATLRGRYFPSSATATTQITFDPPLQFNNGITAISATNNLTNIITFETGRQPQGL